MTASKFDELSKALATSMSRRVTIQMLFASTLGGALSLGSIGTAQASNTFESLCTKGGNCGSNTDNDPLWQAVLKCENGTSHCEAMDSSHGTHPQWVLKKEHQANNHTLIAGQRITGIECYKIWQPSAPDYWAFALQAAQKYLPQHLDTIGLAINSQSGRHYNQLHIHISCINSNVQSALQNDDKNIPRNPKGWKAHMLSLGNPSHQYRVLHLDALRYGGQNLFQLLENMVGQAAMPNQTLVVAARPQGLGGGYYILNSANPDPLLQKQGTGVGENLLNENC